MLLFAEGSKKVRTSQVCDRDYWNICVIFLDVATKLTIFDFFYIYNMHMKFQQNLFTIT